MISSVGESAWRLEEVGDTGATVRIAISARCELPVAGVEPRTLLVIWSLSANKFGRGME